MEKKKNPEMPPKYILIQELKNNLNRLLDASMQTSIPFYLQVDRLQCFITNDTFVALGSLVIPDRIDN